MKDLPPMEKPSFKSMLILGILLFCVGCQPSLRRFTVSRPLMGTLVQITVYSASGDKTYGIIQKAFQEMVRIEDEMSVWNPETPVSRMNRSAFGRPYHVDEEIYRLLEESLKVSRLTQGAFDVTIRPLLQLWPIYRRQKNLPDSEQLQKALSRVGWRYLELNPVEKTVLFGRRGMAVDLGGIAKGYAVDRAIGVLRDAGIRSALVDAGGDLYAMGSKPGGKKWRVGIRDPRKPGKLIGSIRVEDRAVVTSGDYERYFEKNGKRYTHIVDPRTGFTVTGMASVTLIGSNTAYVDALATGVFVLGAKAGMKLIESLPGIEGYLVIHGSRGTIQTMVSSGFSRYGDGIATP